MARCRAAGLDVWAADNLVTFLRRAARGHRPRADTTAPCWSSASATSSVTGGCCCTRRSACRCTPRGRSRSTPGCANGSASRARPSPATTASSYGSPRPTPTRRARSCSCSSRTRSSSWSPTRSADRRCSRPGSASAPPGRCCCRGATPGAAARCGSSGSGRRQLLEVARRYPSFPIVLETVREVLQDVYDVPALVGLLRDVDARRVTVAQVDTQTPSPFARSLMFGYVAAFLYEGDSPLAERRAAALSLDPSLLAELLGRAELRELLDETVVAEVEAELQRLAPDRRARDVEGVADLLRTVGPLRPGEVVERCDPDSPVDGWLAELATSRRAYQVVLGGQTWWAAVEDVGRLRDALGVPVPQGVPDVFTEPVPDPLGDLLARYARSHGPFTAGEVAERWRVGVAVVTDGLRRLAAAGRVVEGEFRPGGRGSEWCDAEVLRRLRRRSLAALRHEVEPVEPATLGRFLPGLAARRRPVARRRRRPGGGRAAGRLRGARLGAGAPGAGCAGDGLPAGHARRAHRVRRGAVGGLGQPAGHRRLGEPAPGRVGAPDPARPRPRRARRCRCHLRRAAPPGARGAGRRRRVLLPAAGRRRRRDRRPGAARRAVGPGVVRPGRQRHPGAAAHPGARRRARRTARRRPPPRSRLHGVAASAGDRRCRRAPGRRPRPAGGRCCPSATPTRPCARTPPPSCCSSGTGSSPGARSRASGCRAGSPRPTGCSARSRTPGAAAAATSSAPSAPPSSPLAGAVDRLRAEEPDTDRPGGRPGAGPARTGAR